jgi:hypothetical protein
MLSLSHYINRNLYFVEAIRMNFDMTIFVETDMMKERKNKIPREYN